MTGLPCFMGWPNHQAQWRGPKFGRLIWPQRNRDLERLYASTDPGEAEEIVARLGLRWVVVGYLARRKFAETPEVLEKFEQIGKPVKRFGDSVLYDMSPEAKMPPDWLRAP